MPRQLIHVDYDHDPHTGEGLLIDLEEPEWNLVRYPVFAAWIDPELEGSGWFGPRFVGPGLLELGEVQQMFCTHIGSLECGEWQ